MPKDYEILSCDEEPFYRYRLDVSTLFQSSNELAVVQLNPSTANSTKSDPTIGKVSKWAKGNGYSRVTFLNLFGIRSADPNDLIGLPYAIVVGPRNDAVSEIVLGAASTIVFAWGSINNGISSHYRQRLDFLKQMLGNRPVHSVGNLVAGQFPRHGRMWNKNNRSLKSFNW